MQQKQGGFSTLEALFLIVILGLVIFAGWHVYLHEKTVNDRYRHAAQSLPDAEQPASATSTKNR